MKHKLIVTPYKRFRDAIAMKRTTEIIKFPGLDSALFSVDKKIRPSNNIEPLIIVFHKSVTINNGPKIL